MTRHGFRDDCEWSEEDADRYERKLLRSMRTEGGLQFLRDLVAALEAMPEKMLVGDVLANSDGCVCAVGAVMKHRGIDPREWQNTTYIGEPGLDDDEIAEALAEDWDALSLNLSKLLKAPRSVLCEAQYRNDESFMIGGRASAADRWAQVHKWATKQLEMAEKGGQFK